MDRGRDVHRTVAKMRDMAGGYHFYLASPPRYDFVE